MKYLKIVSIGILLIAFLLVNAQDTTNENETQEANEVQEVMLTPAEELGFRFFKARNEWDSDAIGKLLAEEVTSRDVLGAKTTEEYAIVVAWYESLNWNWIATSCDELEPSGDSTKILCVVELSNDISRGLENGPNNDGVYEMTWDLEVMNDKITNIKPSFNRTFIAENIQPFQQFIENNHKAESLEMFVLRSSVPKGEENLELYKTYVAEYIVYRQE